MPINLLVISIAGSFLLGFIACDNKVKNKDSNDTKSGYKNLAMAKKDSFVPSNITVQQTTESKNDSEDDDSLYPPIDIPKSFLRLKTISLSDPFDAIKAMKILFPGNYHLYITDWDTIPIVTWTCQSCKTVNLNGVFDNEKVHFPDSFNQTRLLDCLKYKDDVGQEFILLSINTSNQDNEILTGRFERGILGLALFKRQEKKWKLISFNPCVGAYGLFAEPESPTLIKLGNGNFGFIEQDFYQSPGDPTYYQTHIIALVNGNFKELCEINDISMRSTCCTNWSGDIKLKDSLTKNDFGTLQAITHGTLCSRDSLTGEITNFEIVLKYLPAPIVEAFQNKDSLQFEFHRTYEFEKDHYKLKEEKIISIH